MPVPDPGLVPQGPVLAGIVPNAKEVQRVGSDLAREGTQVALGCWGNKKAKRHNKRCHVGDTLWSPCGLGLSLPWRGFGGCAGPSLALAPVI